MKKSILAIAAFLMVAGTVTVISCNKDNEPMQKTNTTSVAMKGEAALDLLNESFGEFLTACDNAYKNDESAFLDACKANDEAAFWEMTGLKPEFISYFCENSKEKLDNYMSEHPEYEPSTNQCEPCSDKPLSIIGTLASATSGNLKGLIPSSLEEYDYYNIFDAIFWYKELPEFNMAASVIAHLGEYFKEIQSEYLNTELFVAKFDNNNPEENEEIPLNFDDKSFLKKYENALNEKKDGNWVAEMVRVFMYRNEDSGELVPVLHVSAYNVDNEHSSNMFIIAKTVTNGNGTFACACARGGGKITINCEKDGGCDSNLPWKCELKGYPGDYYCESTCYGAGNCKKISTYTTGLFSAYNAMFSLVY